MVFLRRLLLILSCWAVVVPVAASAQQNPVPVTVVTVEPQDITLTSLLPGRVAASAEAEVRPQVNGIITERLFEEGADQIPYALKRRSDEFDYGYALTVHKAQGSQWDDIVLFDESWAFREYRDRWLYTAVTRAAQRITVVR